MAKGKTQIAAILEKHEDDLISEWVMTSKLNVGSTLTVRVPVRFGESVDAAQSEADTELEPSPHVQ